MIAAVSVFENLSQLQDRLAPSQYDSEDLDEATNVTDEAENIDIDSSLIDDTEALALRAHIELFSDDSMDDELNLELKYYK